MSSADVTTGDRGSATRAWQCLPMLPGARSSREGERGLADVAGADHWDGQISGNVPPAVPSAP